MDHIKQVLPAGINVVNANRVKNTTSYKCEALIVRPKQDQLAQEMYLEGLGFRVIGRLLKVSHTAVYYWIKKPVRQLHLEQNNEDSIDAAEIDEMHSFVCQKNDRWIWIAVDRVGRRFISFVYGDRSTQTGLRL